MSISPTNQMLLQQMQQLINNTTSSSSVASTNPHFTASPTRISNWVATKSNTTNYVNSIAQIRNSHIIAGQITANRGPMGIDGAGNRSMQIRDGSAVKIALPDGSTLDVKADGSYEVLDKDAKVTYRACRVRDFNPFMNASDKLEEFIRFCGETGVRQSEVLRLPIELFVVWLVISAARLDGEPEPDLPLIPDLRRRALPRCTCGRFLSRLKRERKIDYCAPKCFDAHYARALA
jgi:hypothetical protein